MDINTNYNRPLGGYDINGTDSGRVDGVNTGKDADNSAEIRFQVARGKAASEAGLPELEGANTTSLEEMQEDLKSAMKKLNSTFSSLRGEKVMFDIYALMDIMQEMAQRMRNALREVRQLENQAIQMNLRQQAEVQRYAATMGAIAGGVLCGVQAVVTAGLTMGTVKQMTSQNQLMEQNGVNVYDKQSRMAQNVTDQKAANMQALKVAKSNPELWGETKMPNAEAARTEAGNQGGKVAAAEQELAQAKSEAQALRESFGGLEPNKETLQKIASGEIKTKPDGGQYTIKDRARAMESIPKVDQLEAADAKVTKATEKLDAAKVDLKAAKEGVATGLQKDVDAYAAKYDAVRARANVELETTGKISPETKAELTKAENQLEIARAKQVATVADMRAAGDLPASAETDLKAAADMRYAQATSKSQSGIEATKNQRSIMKLQMIQTLNMTLGQYGQQLVSSLQQIFGSEAVELQADQKMTEDQLDQIKDLFQQELSVIQKTFDLFASVVSKESDTIEGIIRA